MTEAMPAENHRVRVFSGSTIGTVVKENVPSLAIATACQAMFAKDVVGIFSGTPFWHTSITGLMGDLLASSISRRWPMSDTRETYGRHIG